ncbi:hypothetical protein ACFYRC_36725 [Streptomyces sp. NPDC005279]|uniref:hypothetical protein n=1 Tax=Streptomyces sp. NPDC005279 TaxID=3364712 RepID=UPI00369200EA
MIRTARTQRLAVITATTALAAGGAMLSSAAHAAPAPHTTKISSQHDDHHKERFKKKDKPGKGTKKITVTKRTTIIRPDGTVIIKEKTKTIERSKGFHKSNARFDDTHTNKKDS